VSKIFAPNNAATMETGENIHNNRRACSYITWYGGMAYSIWMGGMLPTLGQWYYGALATDNNGGKAPNSHYPSPVVKTSGPGGSSDTDLEAIAWFSGNANGHVHEVAKKAPNSVGLYDISGYFWEWMLDWYISGTGAYTGGQDGVSVVSGAGTRSDRSGSFMHPINNSSIGYRNGHSPSSIGNYWGFRMAAAAP
jgi:formylglycine-generating enzyme required for sulfatase activity